MQVGADNQVSQAASTAQVDQLAKSVAALASKAKGDAKSQAAVPKQFSKLLATMLVKEMRQALPEGFFGDGPGADIFNGWMDEHVGSALAEHDGLRLEDMIAHSMQTKIDASKQVAPETEVRP